MRQLVDTSSWIDALRPNGRKDVQKRVRSLIEAGQAVWCDAVRLELWNGRSGLAEQKRLLDFDRALERLPIDDDVWSLSIDLARKARDAGLTVPATDLIIAACAKYHGVLVESSDEHFSKLAELV